MQKSKQEVTKVVSLDSSSSVFWTNPFLTEGLSGYLFLLPCCFAIPVFNANSVDTDQTPRSVVSYVG